MSKSSPIESYQQDIAAGKFAFNESQQAAVIQIQTLFEKLIINNENNSGVWHRLILKLSKQDERELKGLYIWGGVGRGKTWIVDTFYHCLPFENKMRMHFNRFMRMVHNELNALADIQNPLDVVAQSIAEKARVICFDEFHVSDITDAMLLGGLLKALFDRGVVLVATSNEHSDKLYWDGLQRERFLPAIDLLNKHTTIVNVDSGIDYRLRYLDKAKTFHTPLGDSAEGLMQDSFQQLATEAGQAEQIIVIEHREILTIQCADGVVWFDFPDICDGPRGPADYIEIARLYQTVLISNIPQMNALNDDVCKRFITLVDEFYDRNVKLIVSAAMKPEQLYIGQGLSRSFRRTVSRLIEMQTHDYLARPHLSD
ncbi:MAG: cell division protein ZapE [Gammaproteobacteria bacterium]|nr:cell division protein ZapE [Gammaproteobacteria bacterium]